MTNVAISNDVKAVEDKLIAALGSGIGAGKYLASLVTIANHSSDFRNLSNAVTRAERKGDKTGSTAMRSIIGSVFVGATFGKSKDKRSIVIKSKGAKFDREAYERLLTYTSDKDAKSLRGDLKAYVKGEVKPKEYSLAAVAKRDAKTAIKNGKSKAEYMATMEAAFDAEMKEAKAKAKA